MYGTSPPCVDVCEVCTVHISYSACEELYVCVFALQNTVEFSGSKFLRDKTVALNMLGRETSIRRHLSNAATSFNCTSSLYPI